MTKTELVNSMIKLGFDFEETEDFLKFENADGNSVSIEKNVDNTDVRGKMLSLVGAYLQTPIAERNPEPKFHVRFPGLNSSNGKQYLSTERRPLNGKFFMAAYNPNLIQKFTWKEIQTISNQPGFKGTFMQNAILTNMKKVNSDE